MAIPIKYCIACDALRTRLWILDGNIKNLPAPPPPPAPPYSSNKHCHPSSSNPSTTIFPIVNILLGRLFCTKLSVQHITTSQWTLTLPSPDVVGMRLVGAVTVGCFCCCCCCCDFSQLFMQYYCFSSLPLNIYWWFYSQTSFKWCVICAIISKFNWLKRWSYAFFRHFKWGQSLMLTIESTASSTNDASNFANRLCFRVNSFYCIVFFCLRFVASLIAAIFIFNFPFASNITK